MLFLCCHPVLSPTSAIALTLRAVGGLTTAEIARAFLVPEATMAQRISRAKQRVAGERFSMPSPDERPDRLRSVLRVLYLMFNEGYTGSAGDDLTRVDLSDEAIRLARLVHAADDDPEVAGLLALMLLTDARRPARTDASGTPVTLADQDRAGGTTPGSPRGPRCSTARSVEEPSASTSCRRRSRRSTTGRRSADATDWPQILALYELLERMTGSPVVTLNRAVATAMVHGPAVGLAVLDGVDGTLPRVDQLQAHLHELAGDHDAGPHPLPSRGGPGDERRGAPVPRRAGGPARRGVRVTFPAWSVQDIVAGRPAVRVNQLGYLPGLPMRATLVSADVDPVAFTVVRDDGLVAHEGRSAPWPVRPEPTSGLPVHVLDLGALGEGTFRVEAPPSRSHPFRVGAAVVRRPARRRPALLLPHAVGHRDPRPGLRTPRRPPGHRRPRLDRPGRAAPLPGLARRRHVRRVGRLVRRGRLRQVRHQRGDRGVAAAGHRSTSLPGRARHPGGVPVAARLAAADAGAARATAGGPGVPPRPWHHVVTRCPGWPHLDPTERVLHRPSTTAALHLAAAAAAGARHFRSVDPAYAHRLETAARSAYDAARLHPDVLAPDDHARHGGGPYDDSEVGDDLYWAAAELWLATGDHAYEVEVLRGSRARVGPVRRRRLRLQRRQRPCPARPGTARSAVWPTTTGSSTACATAPTGSSPCRRSSRGASPTHLPDGWGWGSNGRLLNNLVVLGVAHLVTGETAYRDAVATGVDYLLGRNALGQSYVTGYGADHSHHQRTRQFGHDLDPAMPPPPPGALAGGANSVPAPDFPYDTRLVGLPPQLCYLDEPTSEVTNDVCIRWNAPLVWVAAFLTG